MPAAVLVSTKVVDPLTWVSARIDRMVESKATPSVPKLLNLAPMTLDT